MPNVQYDDMLEQSFNENYKRSIMQGIYDLQAGKLSKGSLGSDDGISKISLEGYDTSHQVSSRRNQIVSPQSVRSNRNATQIQNAFKRIQYGNNMQRIQMKSLKAQSSNNYTLPVPKQKLYETQTFAFKQYETKMNRRKSIEDQQIQDWK